MKYLIRLIIITLSLSIIKEKLQHLTEKQMKIHTSVKKKNKFKYLKNISLFVQVHEAVIWGMKYYT